MIDVPSQIKNDYGKLIAKRGIPLHRHNFTKNGFVSILTFAIIMILTLEAL